MKLFLFLVLACTVFARESRLMTSLRELIKERLEEQLSYVHLEPRTIKVGDNVKVDGLQKNTAYNGKIAKVKGQHDNGNWLVEFYDDKKKAYIPPKFLSYFRKGYRGGNNVQKMLSAPGGLFIGRL